LFNATEKICAKVFKACMGVKQYIDPNELIGHSGYGYENRVSKDKVLPYTIHFENDPELATYGR